MSGVIDIRVSPRQHPVEPALATRSGSSRYFTTAPSVAAAVSASSLAIESTQRPRPVEGLGDAGRLEQVLPRRACDGAGDLVGQRLRDPGQPAAHDRDLAVEAGVVEPVVEAAALERVVHLAGAVGGEHDDRRRRGADRAELGDGDLRSRRAPRAGTPRTRRRPGRPRRRAARAGRSVCSARSTGRASRNRSSYSDLLGGVGVDGAAAPPRARAGAGSGAGSPSRRAPGRRRCPRSTAAGSAAGRAPRRAPRPARSCRCRARPRRAAAAASAARGRRPSRAPSSAR